MNDSITVEGGKIRGFRVHHDPRPYDIAAAAAREVVGEKFQKLINDGREKAADFLTSLNTEYDQRKDYLRPASSLNWIPIEKGVALSVKDTEGNLPDGSFSVDEHALSQALGRATVSVPPQYARSLIAAGKQDVLADSLNRLYNPESTYLLRTVGEVRGFLSDSYKIINALPSLEVFVRAAMALGCVPLPGTDLKVRKAFSFIIPQLVYIGDSVVLFGVRWGHSDYGAGRLQVEWFVMRAGCTNLAVGDVVHAKMHLGQRLSGDSGIFKPETRAAQEQTLLLEMKDVVEATFTPKAFAERIEMLRVAAETAIEGEQLDNILKGLSLTKKDQDEVRDRFNRPDVTDLPAGNSTWRLSSAISLFANEVREDRPRDAYHFDELAGKVIGIRKTRGSTLTAVE